MDQYAFRLRHQATNCAFGLMLDEMIRDQIIEKCGSGAPRRKLLEEGAVLDLTRTLEIARLWEASNSQALAMESPLIKDSTRDKRL